MLANLPAANLPALVLFAFASSVTPGPNNIMLMSSGLNFGFKRTLPHFWGVDLGFGLLTLALGLGLAGVLARAPALLVALKWCGAAYLVFLAAKVARARAPDRRDAVGDPLTFAQAVLFQWVNPKAWLGAVTALATYTVPAAYAASVLLVALTMMLVNLPCAVLWTGFGTGMSRWLGAPRRLALFNYTMAALLVASLYPLVRA